MTPTPHQPATLQVDFALDLICPWCWIGLRNLRSAWRALQAQHDGISLQLRWHADTLIPHIPEEGVSYQAFYEARLGSPQAVLARRAQVVAAAQAVGLELNHALIKTFPNTQRVCGLVNAAQHQLGVAAMLDWVDSIFAVYFQQGCDIGDVTVLAQLAAAAGLDGAALQRDAAQAHSTLAPAGGVPYLVFNQQWPVTGAVPAAALLQTMQAALAGGAGHGG